MNWKNVLLAIILYIFLSLSSVFMKFAALQTSLTKQGMFYGFSIITLGIFALLWQKLLKKYNLSKVYVFKATTIIWGMIFGYIFFKEIITWKMILGAFITICGVCVILGERKHE